MKKRVGFGKRPKRSVSSKKETHRKKVNVIKVEILIIIAVILALLLIIFVAVNFVKKPALSPGDIPITECTVINQSGNYYLANDIFFKEGNLPAQRPDLKDCITINTSNVYITGNSHKMLVSNVSGNLWFPGVNVYVNSVNLENITIDGFITNKIFVFYYAYAGVKNLNIINNQISLAPELQSMNQELADNGISIYGVNNNFYNRNVVIRNNTVIGFRQGIFVFTSFFNVTV